MSLAEIICAVCWFNPCAWLLKREIRWNLEFLADRSTLNSGCDREHYQFHLLRLTYQKTVFQLVNNFNVSPLKKRILMMNKKQTSGKSAAKYLLVLPLTVAALLAYNSFDATGQDAKKKSTTQEVGDSVPPSKLIDSAVLVSDTGGVATYSIPGDADVSIEVRTIDGAKDKESVIYDLAEQMPAFPGGEQELMKYIAKNLSYPEDCAKNNIQGTVALRFVVGADGSIGDITVVRPLHSSCDSAAVNVVRNMPKWTPGKINGEAVNVYYIVPIRFKL
jgi:TonB family protein